MNQRAALYELRMAFRARLQRENRNPLELFDLINRILAAAPNGRKLGTEEIQALTEQVNSGAPWDAIINPE